MNEMIRIVTGDGPVLVRALRVTGRVTGLALVCMVLLFVIGEGLPPFWKMTMRQIVPHVCFFGTAVAFLIAWKWELLGALLALGGIAAFFVDNYLEVHGWPGGAFPLFWIPGALLLLAHVSTHLMRRSGEQW